MGPLYIKVVHQYVKLVQCLAYNYEISPGDGRLEVRYVLVAIKIID